MAECLATALRAGELEIAYQPKINLRSGDMVAVEALARWRHPRLGAVPPSEFIPLAEKRGLIDPLTRWMIGKAADDWNAWRKVGLEANLAVNISALSLGERDFPDIVARLCRDHGLPCGALTIELTEGATLGVIELLDALTRFRIKGMNLSLDDFGTGYSSLSQLRQLPFSELKIDRSFVTHADTSRDCRVIVKAVIDLAHNLDLAVVAEGVETKAVEELLIASGCDMAQGYHFAKPMSAADLVAWARLRAPVTHEVNAKAEALRPGF
jgi:EAL domain-containing protein (putative c-di-GMP-specific phosphodiesterase class I)